MWSFLKKNRISMKNLSGHKKYVCCQALRLVRQHNRRHRVSTIKPRLRSWFPPHFPTIAQDACWSRLFGYVSPTQFGIRLDGHRSLEGHWACPRFCTWCMEAHFEAQEMVEISLCPSRCGSMGCDFRWVKWIFSVPVNLNWSCLFKGRPPALEKATLWN